MSNLFVQWRGSDTEVSAIRLFVFVQHEDSIMHNLFVTKYPNEHVMWLIPHYVLHILWWSGIVRHMQKDCSMNPLKFSSPSLPTLLNEVRHSFALLCWTIILAHTMSYLFFSHLDFYTFLECIVATLLHARFSIFTCIFPLILWLCSMSSRCSASLIAF